MHALDRPDEVGLVLELLGEPLLAGADHRLEDRRRLRGHRGRVVDADPALGALGSGFRMREYFSRSLGSAFFGSSSLFSITANGTP